MAMNIIPIGISAHPHQVSSVPGAGGGAKPSGLHDGIPFKSMFETALQNVEETNAARQQDTMALVLGEVDDLAAVNNNSVRAELAFQMMVQMRNRVLDAYQEIMRLNV